MRIGFLGFILIISSLAVTVPVNMAWAFGCDDRGEFFVVKVPVAELEG